MHYYAKAINQYYAGGRLQTFYQQKYQNPKSRPTNIAIANTDKKSIMHREYFQTQFRMFFFWRAIKIIQAQK